MQILIYFYFVAYTAMQKESFLRKAFGNLGELNVGQKNSLHAYRGWQVSGFCVIFFFVK
jgi:hypothetical protein